MTVTAIENAEPKPSTRLWINLRAGLDAVYKWTGYAAAVFIVLILLATMAQIVTRYFGIQLRGLASYAGYFMAASTFLGLANALMMGSHIRIETFSNLLGKRRIYLDLFAYGVSTAISVWFAWYACDMAYWSFAMNDISSELDAAPLWIPQSSMAVGSVLFAIAMIDNFLTTLLTGKSRIQPSSEVL